MMMTQADTNIATILREEREASGRSLEDIAVELKIRTRHLMALEGGQYDKLPPPAFAAGFVRSYADFLGLDGCALARRFREEAGCETAPPVLRFPEPVAESRMPGKAALITGLLGVCAVYFGWLGDFDRGGEVAAAGSAVEPVPARLESAARNPERPAPQTVEPIKVAEDDTARKTVTQAPSMTLQQPGAESPTETEEEKTAQAAVTNAPERVHNAERPVRVTLTATSDAWLRIVDAMNREVWNGVLQAGESWSPDSDDLRLMTSNAGGLVITVDGKTLEPLGHGGDVVRDIPLDPDRLKRGLRLAYN